MVWNIYDFSFIMYDFVKNPCFVYVLNYVSSYLTCFGILSYVIFVVKLSKCLLMKIMQFFLLNILVIWKWEGHPSLQKYEIMKYVYSDSWHTFYLTTGTLLCWKRSECFLPCYWIMFIYHRFVMLLVLIHN